MKKTPDRLPPHSPEAEAAALGCVLRCWTDGDKAAERESELILQQLLPELFYDTRHKALCLELHAARDDGHALHLISLAEWLKTRGRLADAGGLEYIAMLPEKCPSYVNFPEYLAIMRDHAYRRFHIRRGTEAVRTAYEGAEIKELRAVVERTWELDSKLGQSPRPKIELITIEDAQKYVPDPKTYLIGDNVVKYGDIVCIAGWQGLGKSRLANTLAFAGARGDGKWMNYAVRRGFKTLALVTETEASLGRLKDETRGLPRAWNDKVKWSLCRLDFTNPQFRSDLRRHYETWGFDMLIVDHWSDVSRDEGKADFQEALDGVLDALPGAVERPALCLVCHMRKLRGGEGWRPKSGRELLSEIMGNSYITQKARTVFAIQAASLDMADDRVVFECCKCNDGEPEPRSAWHRRNGAFDAIGDFDFDEWQNPPESEKAVTEADMDKLFDGGRRKMQRKRAVQMLRETGFAQSTAYRALQAKGKFAERLSDEDGLLTWRGEALKRSSRFG